MRMNSNGLQSDQGAAEEAAERKLKTPALMWSKSIKWPELNKKGTPSI